MGRSLLAFALHHFDAGANFLIGHVPAELTTHYGPELCLVLPVSPVCLTRRVAPVSRLLNIVIRVPLGPGRASTMLLLYGASGCVLVYQFTISYSPSYLGYGITR